VAGRSKPLIGQRLFCCGAWVFKFVVCLFVRWCRRTRAAADRRADRPTGSGRGGRPSGASWPRAGASAPPTPPPPPPPTPTPTPPTPPTRRRSPSRRRVPKKFVGPSFFVVSLFAFVVLRSSTGRPSSNQSETEGERLATIKGPENNRKEKQVQSTDCRVESSPTRDLLRSNVTSPLVDESIGISSSFLLMNPIPRTNTVDCRFPSFFYYSHSSFFHFDRKFICHSSTIKFT